MRSKTFWLSYGAGLNSTALLVLLCEGKLPQYTPFRIIWADTKDEKDETYRYVFEVVWPYLRRWGRTLETVCDYEGVLERWERLSVTGSRTFRACTDHSKIQPIHRHIKAHGTPEDVQLLGIDAGEVHRARPSYPTDPHPKMYPLVELDYDRDACKRIIEEASLPVPIKSGCWHCPFMRKREILDLAIEEPCRFRRIIALELVSIEKSPPPEGKVRAQWGDRPAAEWWEMARGGGMFGSSEELDKEEGEPPCGCYDG